MSFFRAFFTPKGQEEPGPPLSAVLHPYYPKSLLLPGYEPLVIPFERILYIFFGSSTVVFIALWLASGVAPVIDSAQASLRAETKTFDAVIEKTVSNLLRVYLQEE